MTAAGPATLLKQNLAFPEQGFARLREEGLLLAPLTERWGIEPGTHQRMLETLCEVGGRDLSLGRLYEGHVNALFLVAKFGDVAEAEADLRRGRIFGVWNTDAPDGVTARREGGWMEFSGRKAFGSGAGSVTRPIVTAEIEGEGRVMCLLPMEQVRHSIDYESWHPMGMLASDSFTVDFTGARAIDGVVIGHSGDYYRQPAFTGGAIRFAAVQFGAVARIADCFSEWLRARDRGADPYQRARAGEIAIAVQTGRQWMEAAAREAELHFHETGEPGAGKMVHFANMTRLAIERICLDVMERVTRGVGARGLLEPTTFGRQIRDLSMYLRQPAPDQALAEVGRMALLR